MKLPAGLIALCGLAFCGALPAQAPHEHGVASLDIRVEGDRLDLRLRAPLESMAGLEKPPRTERQRQAVRRMASTLHDPQALFMPTAAAGCTAREVVLRSDALAPELLSPAPAADAVPASGTASTARKPAPPAHPDLEAQVTFRCAKPQALTGLQVRVFEAFPSLREVGVAIATPRGDSGVRLSPSRTSLTW